MSKKIKIQITSWLNGSVLFEYESVDNTIAKTVNEAVKNNANLSSADLRYADLSSADLRSADLRSADLSYANLRSADLRYADLSYANLSSADLRSADLSYANLSYADLSYANLSSADLRSADLSYANLRSADLRYANLSSADLRSADLSYANLSYADLSYADLSYANLRSADLSYANLRSADLRYAKNSELAIAITRILPEGEIIGYKKCADSKIVKLLIPKEAKRSHSFGRKCRAEYAEVLEITKGSRKLKTARSTYDDSFVYKVGETVKPTKKFSENWVDECDSGIHFFITKLEAENYDV